jgi:hypothetical protein
MGRVDEARFISDRKFSTACEPSMNLDPIVTSLIQHRLHAIVDEMGEGMLRTIFFS